MGLADFDSQILLFFKCYNCCRVLSSNLYYVHQQTRFNVLEFEGLKGIKMHGLVVHDIYKKLRNELLVN